MGIPGPLPRKLAPPLATEKKPIKPIKWEQPDGAHPYKVQNNDTWEKVAIKFRVKPDASLQERARYLILYNFQVNVTRPRSRETDEVNWYLRNYVGCNVTKDGGKNWSFSTSAEPGIIFIPPEIADFEGDGTVVVAKPSLGDKVSTPEYDDSNFYDVISKALDIYTIVDMGLGVSGVALPVLLEAGLIAASAVAGVVAPAVAVGSGHADALRIKTRKHFFTGFADALVMAANGASADYIRERRIMNHTPHEVVYPEKAESFRKLHNAGVELGIKKGKQFNEADKAAFFKHIYPHLREDNKAGYDIKVFRSWDDRRKKEFYDELGGVVRRHMLDNNLQLKIR